MNDQTPEPTRRIGKTPLYHGPVAKAENGLLTKQTAKTDLRPLPGSPGERIRAQLRFDDSCRNGHMSFGITANIVDARGMSVGGGAAHDDIARAFPALRPLVKWHLCSTEGPMHYVSNTCYHASDCDYNGLRAGETKPLRNGRTGQPCWELVTRSDKGEKVRPSAYSMVDSDTKPDSVFMTVWEPRLIMGEGKARDLSAARNCAIWPDASDAILTSDKATLSAALEKRLPALLLDFKKAMVETCGFQWFEAESTS